MTPGGLMEDIKEFLNEAGLQSFELGAGDWLINEGIEISEDGGHASLIGIEVFRLKLWQKQWVSMVGIKQIPYVFLAISDDPLTAMQGIVAWYRQTPAEKKELPLFIVSLQSRGLFVEVGTNELVVRKVDTIVGGDFDLYDFLKNNPVNFLSEEVTISRDELANLDQVKVRILKLFTA
jgi:hypothetical protein